MTIDISDNDPRISYSVAEGVTQTTFSVPFEFFEDGDITVYVDDVEKTITTDYTVSGGGGATGSISMSVTGASGGSIVVIVRDIPVERTSDFPAGTDINRAALNEQLDSIVGMIADVHDKADRTLQITDSEVNPGTTLPGIDARKGRVIAFNSTTGAIEVGPLSNDIATIASNITEILAADDEAAAAAASATAAATSQTAAASSATAAAASETAAASSETNAAASETAAATSATSAATSATAAASSATAAAASETNAGASETAAASSETAAATSATAAASSATAAASSATAASTSETNAASSQTAAATSATNAATSATNAATSETNAATSASAASTSASNAATSATNAATSETNAATSATSAASSATSAATQASNAQTAADAALAALDNFDDRYLGQKASDPTTDNDGDPLVAGALYFNTTDDVMKVYEGSAWVAAYASLSGALTVANNLSDVASVSAARTNLGLGTAATTASTDYAAASHTHTLSQITDAGTAAASASTDFATAAQGALADSATQPGDNISTLTNDAGYTTNVGDITGVTAGGGITGGGTSGTVTVSHANTSSQGSVNNSGATVIQDVTLDGYGHVTSLGSATITTTTIGAATSAQGALANSAVQPGDNISTLTNNSGYLTNITGQSIKNLSDVYSTMSPTNGQVLTYNTTNGWRAEDAGGAGLEFITSANASNSSSLDFTAFDSSKYDGYMFIVGNLRPASNVVLGMHTSSNGGSTWDQSTNQYSYWESSYNVGMNGNGVFAPSVPASKVPGSYYQGISGVVYLPHPDRSNYTMINWNMAFQNHESLPGISVGGGYRKSAAAVTGLRFKFYGANISSGTVTMYGLKNA